MGSNQSSQATPRWTLRRTPRPMTAASTATSVSMMGTPCRSGARKYGEVPTPRQGSRRAQMLQAQQSYNHMGSECYGGSRDGHAEARPGGVRQRQPPSKDPFADFDWSQKEACGRAAAAGSPSRGADPFYDGRRQASRARARPVLRDSPAMSARLTQPSDTPSAQAARVCSGDTAWWTEPSLASPSPLQRSSSVRRAGSSQKTGALERKSRFREAVE